MVNSNLPDFCCSFKFSNKKHFICTLMTFSDFSKNINDFTLAPILRFREFLPPYHLTFYTYFKEHSMFLTGKKFEGNSWSEFILRKSPPDTIKLVSDEQPNRNRTKIIDCSKIISLLALKIFLFYSNTFRFLYLENTMTVTV